MSTRRRSVLLALVLAAFGLCGIFVDAARRRALRDESSAQNAAVVDVTGLADLALSSSARWLRHPSQTEAGAAMSDLPSSLDVDPAGALIGPPRAILGVGGVDVVVRR